MKSATTCILMVGTSSLFPFYCAGILVAFCLVAVAVVVANSYKRCPAGKLLVVYGARLPDTHIVVESGGRFVLRLVQDCAYLSLAPLEITLPDQRQITMRIGDSPALRRNAVVHLLGLSEREIVDRVKKLVRSGNRYKEDQALRNLLATAGLAID